MRKPKWNHVLALAGCLWWILMIPAGAHATSVFVIETDTSSISGVSGFIDLQYNALSGAGYSIASITDFSTDGSLSGPLGTSFAGDASGDLASTVTIGNGALDGSSYNDYDEAMTFGTYLQFLVAFSGPPPGGTANSQFTLSYYNSDYSAVLLSADPSGASATLTMQPDGTVLTQVYADSGGSYDTGATEIPEPASLFIAAAGIALSAAVHRRRRH